MVYEGFAEDPFIEIATLASTAKYDDVDTEGQIFDIFVVIRGLIYLGLLMADFIIAYVIIKYKRLKSRMNNCIMYYVIFNAIEHIWYPLYLLSRLLSGGHPYEAIVCVLHGLYFASFYLSFSANLLLGLEYCVQKFDWNIKTCMSRTKLTFFAIALMQTIFSSGFCFKAEGNILTHVFIELTNFIYYICTLIVLVLDVVIWRKSSNTVKDCNKHILVIVNLNVLCWFPQVLYDLLFTYADDVILYSILLDTEFIPEGLTLLNPFLNLIILYICNKNFKVAIHKFFKINKNYDDEIDHFLENEGSSNDNTGNSATHNNLDEV